MSVVSTAAAVAALQPIVMELCVDQALDGRMRARARAEGRSLQEQVRLALRQHLDGHDQGELRHPDDVACDFDRGLARDQELL